MVSPALLRGATMLNQKRRAKKLRNRKTKPSKVLRATLGTCVDCGEPFLVSEEYLLRNAIWDQAAKRDERLHRKCFEKRLGRELTDADYLSKFYVEGNQVKGVVLDWQAYVKENPGVIVCQSCKGIEDLHRCHHTCGQELVLCGQCLEKGDKLKCPACRERIGPTLN
jgi:hypothetical protein